MNTANFDTLVGLVSHYSPSGRERGAVDWLVRHMKSLGYDQAHVDEAGNAVGVIGSGPLQIVLLGHIDTVPGEIEIRRDRAPADSDEVLYGRGTVDAKGPLACFVDAAALARAGEGWQLVVIGAVEEERDSEGARFVASQYRPHVAIIGEPSQWDRIALGYKGSAWASLTVRRGQAHSASGEQTAAEAALEGWLALRQYVDSFNREKAKAFDRLLLTLRGMASGSDDFEQWARLAIGVRLPPGVEPGAWYQIVSRLAGEAEVEPSGFAIPAWRCDKNTPLVRAFLRAIRTHGGEPRFVYKTGTSDLNIVAPIWQCPAVVYGPGDSSRDHTPDEHISLAAYASSVRVLKDVLQALAYRAPSAG